MNQGQICMSTERIIVVEAVADEFAAKFKAKDETKPDGDPREGKTPLGAVVDRKTVEHCYSLIEEAVGKGAALLTGGETTQNVLMPAHLVDKVTPDMKLFRDESFGPVVGIIRARDEAHAIELANDTEYGLSSAVFTRDTARGIRVARQIHSGI
jgi:acyl-CoA reductase-like NAD-dependent aldehyde dehydrogenase